MTRHPSMPQPGAAAGAVLLAALLTLAGCGQTGPLYLPERTPIEVGEADPDDEEDSRENDARETAQAEPSS